MYNYNKLLGKIKEKGLTMEQLSKTIHINVSTLSGKMNNKSEFRQSEMLSICKTLGIEVADIEQYFFCSDTLENESSMLNSVAS